MCGVRFADDRRCDACFCVSGRRGVHFGDALLDDYVDDGGEGFGGGAGDALLQAEADSFFAAGAPDQAGSAPPGAPLTRKESALATT